MQKGRQLGMAMGLWHSAVHETGWLPGLPMLHLPLPTQSPPPLTLVKLMMLHLQLFPHLSVWTHQLQLLLLLPLQLLLPLLLLPLLLLPLLPLPLLLLPLLLLPLLLLPLLLLRPLLLGVGVDAMLRRLSQE